MYFGIDIGGTNIRVASSNSVSNPHIIDRVDFLNSPDYESNIAKVTKAINKLTDTVEGIGVGMPGRLNAERTTITNSRSVQQWVGQPFVETLSQMFDCTVCMQGDQHCAALSETFADRSITDFYFIVYGTGLGAARVTYQAGVPIVKKFSDDEHAKYLLPWQLACGGKWVKERLGKSLAELSEAEWQVIIESFYEWLLKMVTDLKPPRLVFGGGVAMKQWTRLQPVFQKLRTEHPDFKDLYIRPAHYKEDAGLYGALLLLSSRNDNRLLTRVT